MALEGGAGGALVLHHGAEGQGGGEGDAERVGDGEVMLGKGVFLDVQAQAAV